MQETLTDASRTLYTALDGKVYFKQVTVVVPDGWTATRCRVRVGEPREGTSFQVRGKGEQCLLLDMHRINWPITDFFGRIFGMATKSSFIG